MTTSVGATRTPPMGDSELLARVTNWVKTHQKATTWIVSIVAIAAALLTWTQISNRRSEKIASAELTPARLAFEARNFQLASSELSRLVENYSGTNAANEAELILGQVRLAQGQSEAAIEQLRKFAPGANRLYRAQAFGLLAAAYENVGHAREAAEAYQRAADGAELPFLRAQFLSDVGRSWVEARDTAKAIAAYQEIVSKLDSTGSAVEARVRLGELTRGAVTRMTLQPPTSK